jgi:DNA invertase Pin-like site-specific DNA recombinase
MMFNTLRFGALVRVSTETQEKQGESLRTQRAQVEAAVESLGGSIAGWYGGQEHATPGWEKGEVDRLIGDAGKGRLDAVIVANADRWSRDNVRSTKGLEVFRDAGIRFYVGTTEYDLMKPEHRLFLGMSAVMGQFFAENQKLKSLQNRIARAKRGLPTCGKLPFGRTFDRATGLWGIDADKRRMVEDVARRYLKGQALPKLAEEYGVNASNLHKILTKRCGDTWEQHFDADAFNIHEVVVTKVPSLLDNTVIEAICNHACGNRTYYRGAPIKHSYLLARVVFCAHCGRTMTGQTNQNGKRYYRHPAWQPRNGKAFPECAAKGMKAWVNADELEDAVFWQLCDTFGNPAAVQKAIEDGTPNAEQVTEHRAQAGRLRGELAKVAEGQDKILRLVGKGVVTEEEAEGQLSELRERKQRLTAELDSVAAVLSNLPTPGMVKAFGVTVAGKFRQYLDARKLAKRQCANTLPERATWEEKRGLMELVFSGEQTDGNRLGVYIEWVEGQEARRRKSWSYHVRGRLIDVAGTVPAGLPFDADDPEAGWLGGGLLQRQLLDAVSESALP